VYTWPAMQSPDRIDIRIGTSIRPGDILDAATDYPADSGATCHFIGHTRAEHSAEGGRLLCLSYEAHDALASSRLRRHAEEVLRTFDVERIVVHHALGDIPVGAPSVIVSVTAPHRKDAFGACQSLMDALKRDVPIWKREIRERKTTWSPGSIVPTEPLT